MILTDDNYYSDEANKYYVSASQYKDFCGTYGIIGCESKAVAKVSGYLKEDPTDAMLIGSYVDSYFEGTLDRFLNEHPEIISTRGKTAGQLKSQYKHADKMIERAKRDKKFMQYLSGDKQIIMTGSIRDVPVKIKMDSYIEGRMINDLKTVQSISRGYWVRDIGYLSFIDYWGYDIQAAIYQEITRQNTGKKLPFFITAISKEPEPNIEVIQIEQYKLDNALEAVSMNIPLIQKLKLGETAPTRCERCEWCRSTKVIQRPILSNDIELEV